MAMRIDCSRGLKQLERDFGAFQRKQLPFAAALALTTLAKGVQEAERAELSSTFKNPTPFTKNAYAVRPARKSSLTATVFAKDIQAAYLEPFVDGGTHYLGGKKGLLVPKNVPLNQYGNLTRGKLEQLKGQPNVFIGPVKFKNGSVVRGVWQRNDALRGARRGEDGKRGTGGYGTKGRHSVVDGQRTTLKLLIRFSDAQPVQQHLDFQGRARSYLEANFEREFSAAFAKALATAK